MANHFTVAEAGRKASIVWRALHLSTWMTALGVVAAVVKPDAANGIGIMLGSFQVALGGIVATYANSQSKVDVAEAAHGVHPKRQSVQMGAVNG
jgi:hypothetical protein